MVSETRVTGRCVCRLEVYVLLGLLASVLVSRLPHQAQLLRQHISHPDIVYIFACWMTLMFVTCGRILSYWISLQILGSATTTNLDRCCQRGVGAHHMQLRSSLRAESMMVRRQTFGYVLFIPLPECSRPMPDEEEWQCEPLCSPQWQTSFVLISCLQLDLLYSTFGFDLMQKRINFKNYDFVKG